MSVKVISIATLQINFFHYFSYPNKEQNAQLGLGNTTSLPRLKDKAGITGYVSSYLE
jgi:hypothetical protein